MLKDREGKKEEGDRRKAGTEEGGEGIAKYRMDDECVESARNKGRIYRGRVMMKREEANRR